MKFHKYHALGNDYIVIDPNTETITLTEDAIRLICHRNFGAGSDGILYGPIFTGTNIGVKIYNPDGSEAEKSGNGVRIFSKFLHDQGYVTEKGFTLHTLGGDTVVEYLNDDATMITVDMGPVTFRSELIPVSGAARDVVDEAFSINGREYRITCVSIGNPHCVIPLDDISEALAREIGPLVEHHPIFPNRINLQLMRIIDRRSIQIEIWERGAGYTLASGSSSCAAASAAFRLGLVDREIDVTMPGGRIGITIADNGHVHMTGPVTAVYTGSCAPGFPDTVKG